MTPHPHPSVLVVEDEPMLLLVASETLRDAGYTVQEACDGASAIATLETDAGIDVLLTDIKMPGMNGFQLAETGLRLKPRLKVILMTGYTQEPMPKAMQEAGARLLYKPFDIDRLPALIEEVLRA